LAKHRIWSAAAFFCPVGAGIIYMAFAGAPTPYLLTNAAAALCVAIAFWRAPRLGSWPISAATMIIVPVLLACSFAGPAVDGVHRWIALGPLKLHIAMGVLPYLATQMFWFEGRLMSLTIMACSVITAFQPDGASSAALASISLCLVCFRQNRWAFAALLVASTALVAAVLNAEALAPVRFVEYVIADAYSAHVGIAALLFASMVIAVIGPIYSGWRFRAGLSAPLMAWSACLIGFFVASFAGPYPVPLLGYGVSSILGFGLALAVLGQKGDRPL
jgi:cell division protein FtsW (lipid II flippase)